MKYLFMLNDEFRFVEDEDFGFQVGDKLELIVDGLLTVSEIIVLTHHTLIYLVR